jgi:MFS superfamily sulfate permease-like transporter
LANQVSFLNKASLEKALRSIPEGGDAILDARSTDYIDPDVLSFIREFKEVTAPANDIRLSLQGFRERYQFVDDVQFVDFSPRETRAELKPDDVLKMIDFVRDGVSIGTCNIMSTRRRMDLTRLRSSLAESMAEFQLSSSLILTLAN